MPVGRRVVVGPSARAGRLARVAAQHPEVEVPALRLLDPPLPRPVVDRERRQPGCDAEALLRARVREVDAPLVEPHRHAAEGGDAVGQQEGVALAGGQRGEVGEPPVEVAPAPLR